MTLLNTSNAKKAAPASGSLWLSLAVLFFFLLLYLKNGALVSAAVREGLRLCLESILPTLLPMMILSELLFSMLLQLPRLPRCLTPIGARLGLSDVALLALMEGLLCGFPIGVRAACRLLEAGRISRAEAERILRYGNPPSVGFLIGVVGTSLHSDRSYGVLLFLSVVLVALLCAALDARKEKRKSIGIPSVTEIRCSFLPEALSIRIFTDAVARATQGLLLICSYVLFFSSLGGIVDSVLTDRIAPPAAKSLLFCLLELSNGVRSAACLPPPWGGMLTAFAAGWSGISVHCQLCSLCDRKGFHLLPYLRTKLLQGALAAILFGSVLAMLPR